MIFNTKLVLFAAAMVSVAKGAVVELDSRQQGDLAFCIFGVSPTGTVNPGANLNTEFTTILNQRFAQEAPQGIITNREAIVSGGGDFYSVDKPLGAVGNTASQNRAIVSAWLGETLPAAGTGTTWVIQTISCQT